VSLPGDEFDVDLRLTTLTICERALAAADERAMPLDDVLTKLEKTISDDAVTPARPASDPGDPELDVALRGRGYREAAVPLAMLSGPIMRSLADFLG
jgi:hypothetical protein